ncbi:defensin-like [Crassostrea virginica]
MKVFSFLTILAVLLMVSADMAEAYRGCFWTLSDCNPWCKSIGHRGGKCGGFMQAKCYCHRKKK